MPHRRLSRLALVACVVGVVLGCSIFRGVTASASCAGVSPDAIRATLAAEEGATVKDVGDGTLALNVWATLEGMTAHVRIEGDRSVLLLAVGSAGGLPDGVTDDDVRRRADELTTLLSARHPELGPWEIEDHTASATWVGDTALAAFALFMIFVFPVLAVTGLALWLVKRLNAATRAREREPPDASA